MQRFLLNKSKDLFFNTQHFAPAMVSMARFQAFSVAAARFPSEPGKPMVRTAYPGPKTKEYFAENASFMCSLQMEMVLDMQNCIGNYITDIDGNKFLDVLTSFSCVGMGYNHPALLEAGKTDLMKHTLATRTGVGINPPMEYIELS